MIDIKLIPSDLKTSLRAHVSQRLEGLRNDRMSFWAHWAQLAEVFLPRRYKFLITPNQSNRGAQINTAIVDETGVIAARTLGSGMMAGLTSPTRPWFRMGLNGLDEVGYGPVKEWLAEVERRMMRVFSESNFYQSLAVFYHDLAVFGSGSQIIYEDPDEIIRCYNPCLGEFFFGASARGDVDTHYREFTLNVIQVVEQFGYENCSSSICQLYMQGGASLQTEIVVCHAIEPNFQLYDQFRKGKLPFVVPASFKYREVYWTRYGNSNDIIAVAGFKEKPFVGGRWDVSSNDAYGRSPGMDGMPATRQLQIEQRRKAEAIDKLVRPPMVASVSMKNEPASILPSAITYVADVQNSGFKPAYQVEPHLQEMNEDIQEVQARIKSVFFVDLFLMISQLDTVRTATEIDARREEKLIQLGPVIERFENEVLDPIIDRVFAIMLRRGLIPPAPSEIAGAAINVQYISMLAEAQRAAATAGIERLLQVAGNLAGVDPDIMDNIDLDATIEEYADQLAVPPKLIRSIAAVAQIRDQKAKQAQAMQAAQLGMAGVEAAKNLSETDLGGGQNALSAMIH
jgi:hypothetical protein